MNVLVLGCGPAGLVAAHAAALAGADVRIASKPRKSYMKGAQYLHAPIPGVPARSFDVQYKMWGTAAEYRAKVYGQAWDGVVSPEDFEGVHTAWDIRTTYDWLWETYGPYVQSWEASPGTLRMLMDKLKPDLTVSSVPAPLICPNGHAFAATTVYSTDRSMYDAIRDDQVICNALENPRWYRVSKIQGFENTEWAGPRRPPFTPMWDVIKPTKNTCDCWPDVLRVGRYGNWKKGVLSHEGFAEVSKCLQNLTDPSSL